MSKFSIDSYIFDINDYEIIRKINQGGFGVVNLVQNKKTKIQFAAKTNFMNTHLPVKRVKQMIAREVGILVKVRHPTIIRFQGFTNTDFKGNKNITIFLDFMKNGSLSNLLDLEFHNSCPSKYDNTKRQILLIGIARGMMILHQLHIINRDLKAENILLDENYYPRITDFGLSKFYDPRDSMFQTLSESGTAVYMAPEVIQSNSFNTKADVYAFGILMNEILSGKRAYNDLLTRKRPMTIFQLKTEVVKGLRPDIDSNMKKGLQRMIKQCLLTNPKERPSFRELFFKLSLSKYDFMFNFNENGFEENVIEDDEEDEIEEDDDETKNLMLNKQYCLDNVDIGEILDYVDEVSEEPNSTLNFSNSQIIKDKEISELKEQIKELKDHEEASHKEIEDLKEREEASHKEIEELKEREEASHKEIEELKEREVEKNKQIEALEELVKNMQIKIDDKEQKKLQKHADMIDEKIETGEFTDTGEMTSGMDDTDASKSSQIEEFGKQTKSVEDAIKTLDNKSSKTDSTEIKQVSSLFCDAEISLETPGILEQLKSKEKTKFDRYFIASQSSCDLYNIIDPETKDFFCSSNSGNFYINFELEESIEIKGMQIFSSLKHFPKSFDISIDKKLIKSIKEANELNGANKMMSIEFEPISGKNIRFTQTGPNWDKNSNWIDIVRIEILSSSKKFSEGVFSTLIKECSNCDQNNHTLVKKSENNDPHLSRVFISSSCFDLNSFHSLNSARIISTNSHKNSWFQIELACGFAILNGFRLKKNKKHKLKSFKIICSDDINKPKEEWTTLIEVDEEKEDEHQDLDIYKFTRPSPPTKIIRLVMTGKNWSNQYCLQFFHIDFFGRISNEETNFESIKNCASSVNLKTGKIVTADPNLESPGILEQLKNKEKNKFNRYFTASLSSGDLYNIIDPETKDYLGSSNSGNFYINFELEESIEIKGIQIFSSLKHFPKSFDISIDKKLIKSIKEANELNGANKMMSIEFDPISGKNIRFTQTGPNWDKNSNWIDIVRIEILSSSKKFSEGVFSTLIKECLNCDPHFSPVSITSSGVDLNSFHLLSAKKSVSTESEINPWFQIELACGFAILNGFRLKKNKKHKLKSFKIICSDDINKPKEEWTTLIEVDEEKEDEHQDLDIYKFTRPSPPTKIIRLIMTNSTWDNKNYLIFYHIDYFGSYF